MNCFFIVKEGLLSLFVTYFGFEEGEQSIVEELNQSKEPGKVGKARQSVQELLHVTIEKKEDECDGDQEYELGVARIDREV